MPPVGTDLTTSLLGDRPVSPQIITCMPRCSGQGCQCETNESSAVNNCCGALLLCSRAHCFAPNTINDTDRPRRQKYCQTVYTQQSASTVNAFYSHPLARLLLPKRNGGFYPHSTSPDEYARRRHHHPCFCFLGYYAKLMDLLEPSPYSNQNLRQWVLHPERISQFQAT